MNIYKKKFFFQIFTNVSIKFHKYFNTNTSIYLSILQKKKKKKEL